MRASIKPYWKETLPCVSKRPLTKAQPLLKQVPASDGSGHTARLVEITAAPSSDLAPAPASAPAPALALLGERRAAVPSGELLLPAGGEQAAD